MSESCDLHIQDVVMVDVDRNNRTATPVNLGLKQVLTSWQVNMTHLAIANGTSFLAVDIQMNLTEPV